MLAAPSVALHTDCIEVTEGDQGKEQQRSLVFPSKPVKRWMIPGWETWHVVMDGERELGVGVCGDGLHIRMKDYLRRY